MHKRHWRLIGGAALAMAVGVVLLGLAGSLPYVTTHGVSMEPRFHRGDLVVLRPAGAYRVGDVVAYRSRLLDTVVMHRVIGRDGDEYLLKGDNNTWTDSERPTRSELLGREWLRVPRGGLVIDWLRARWPVLGAVPMLLVAAFGTSRRHRRRKLGTHVRNGHGAPSVGLGRIPQALLPVAAVGTVAFLALGAFAYTRPVTQWNSTKVAYAHEGNFSYSASAPAGPVYDNGVTTGDPLFLRIVNSADLRFSYQLKSDSPRAVSGVVSLTAEVSDANGWRRRLELAAPSPFRGDTSEVHATIDLVRIQALIAEVEALTGVRSGTHTVTVAADVKVNGSVAGQQVNDTFAPDLAFKLDPFQLRPAWTPADISSGADPLTPSEPGSVTRPDQTGRQLSAFGRHVAVADARAAALVGALACAAAIGVLFLGARRQRRDEVAVIKTRHGHRIVPVAAGGGETTGALVDVTTMADLARLAEQYGCLILHNEHNGAHSYMFQVDRTMYRYRIQRRAHAAS